MEKKYENVIDYINDCYINDSFDKKQFEFYALRKEKEKNRAGIYNTPEQDYFFKMVDVDYFNNEDEIREMIKPNFRIVTKFGSKQFGDRVINLYEKLDTVGINTYNFLRDNEISLQKKSAAMDKFFADYTSMQERTLAVEKMKGDKLSDVWFQNRTDPNGRSSEYYGPNMIKLLTRIKNECPEYYSMYEDYILNIPEYLSQNNDMVTAYMHGDFHDFNFSLQGIFWDTDTFGINPVLNDFTIYYWHFYGREDGYILKYSPWLHPYMFNKLSTKEFNEMRDLKQETILNWYDSIEKFYDQYGIKENIGEEFRYKLFCRNFLVDNTLNYTPEDFKKVVQFYGQFLENRKENVKQLLFNTGIRFTEK